MYKVFFLVHFGLSTSVEKQLVNFADFQIWHVKVNKFK